MTSEASTNDSSATAARPSDADARADGGAQADAGARAQARPAEAPPGDALLHCLIKVTHYYGRPVTEADLRAATPVPAGGMSLPSFERAAQRLGYKVGRQKVDAGKLAHLPTPFVTIPRKGRLARLVIERDQDDLVLLDPFTNERSLVRPGALADEVAEAFLVKPDSGVGDRGRRHHPSAGWRGLISSRLRGVLWELALASLVINLFALIAPLFTMTVYNKVIGQAALDTLTVLSIGMITIYGFEFILRVVRGYVSSHTGARLDALIGGEVVHRLLHQPFSYFEGAASGQISERLRQLDTIRNFFTGQMPMTVVDLAFVSIFLIALFFISPIFAALALGAIPLFVLLSLMFHKKQKALIEHSFAALAAKSSALNETVNNAVTIKSLGLESDVERRWEGRLAATAWHGFKAHNLSNWLTSLTTTLQQVIGLAVIFIGARLVIERELTIGALIAASILVTRAIAPMRQVVSAWYQVQEVKAAFNRLSEIMEAKPEEEPGDVAPQPPLRGDIKVDAVTYSFDRNQPPVLRNVTVEFASGEVVAIIGPSGSGKSTLAKILQGLYPPDSGRVLIDGTDIHHISRASLRAQLGVVPQETQLFAGTVRENIMMGQPLDAPERAVAAAKFVGAHDFIQRLPRGYDTPIGERGVGISAGQRQLLCVARALIRNPRILILDEATSALDPAAEEALLVNLRRQARGRTIILITHRMAPLSIADKAVLLINGQVDKVGPPKEVVAYARERMAPQRTAETETEPGGDGQPDGAPPDPRRAVPPPVSAAS
ncbi:MAG: peptidase domain-containing ABC transporter [Alphaproteobacteria bacterium]